MVQSSLFDWLSGGIAMQVDSLRSWFGRRSTKFYVPRRGNNCAKRCYIPFLGTQASNLWRLIVSILDNGPYLCDGLFLLVHHSCTACRTAKAGNGMPVQIWKFLGLPCPSPNLGRHIPGCPSAFHKFCVSVAVQAQCTNHWYGFAGLRCDSHVEGKFWVTLSRSWVTAWAIPDSAIEILAGSIENCAADFRPKFPVWTNDSIMWTTLGLKLGVRIWNSLKMFVGWEHSGTFGFPIGQLSILI